MLNAEVPDDVGGVSSGYRYDKRSTAQGTLPSRPVIVTDRVVVITEVPDLGYLCSFPNAVGEVCPQPLQAIMLALNGIWYSK